jgi:probable rRNA maturation factor
MVGSAGARASPAVPSGAVIEVDVLDGGLAPDGPPAGEITRLCVLAARAAGVDEGHLAIEYVDAHRIAELNIEHRGKPGPTDVLSFPIDGVAAQGDVPRELGDVIICPEHTVDLREAIVHGVLHLMGMDHETDDGEMLTLQAKLLGEASTSSSASSSSSCL